MRRILSAVELDGRVRSRRVSVPRAGLFAAFDGPREAVADELLFYFPTAESI
jgi:hypothetical protein